MLTEWRVHIEHQPMRLTTVRVHLYRRVGSLGDGEIEVLHGDGTISRVPEGAELPDDAGLQIPRDAWDALVEHAAAQSHLGAQNGVLREWLKAERFRVDSVLDPAKRQL